MNNRLQAFQTALANKSALKVIAGIANDNLAHVLTVVSAANQTAAHAIDVTAKPEIISAVRQATDKTLFASSIQACELIEAVTLGADAVELGNFDALYAQGTFITAEEVFTQSQALVEALVGKALVCVTIPGHLAQDAQVALAQKLEAIGVDLIQTEGAVRLLAEQPQTAPISTEAKFDLTVSNTAALVQAVRIPVMSATGVSSDNVARAFAVGAAAVGIGSAVNQHQDAAPMVAEIEATLAAIPVGHKATVVA